MRFIAFLSVSAALVCCLAASPARADLADSDADDAGSSSGQLLSRFQEVTHLLEESAIIPDNVLTISQTRSSGPSTVPPTSKGVDRTEAAPGTFPVGSETRAGARLFERASQSASQTDSQTVSGDPVPAAAPPLQAPGELNRYVGDPPVPGADIPTMGGSPSTPLDLTGTVIVATPLPAAAFLLGGGLLGILPLRRFARFSLGA
jgi:hypothetical protein